MNGADAGAGQHGDGSFRNHGHVQRYAVALDHPQRTQAVREPADLLIKVPVGDVAGHGRVVALEQQRRTVATLREGIGGSIIATWSTANGFISKSGHGNHIDFAIQVPAATTAALGAPSSGVYDLDISYDGLLGSWTVRHAEGAFYITPNV